MNDSIFREYDIRGIVERELTEGFAYKLGRAFALYVKRQTPHPVALSVGRDVRTSSDYLAKGLIDGMLTEGVHVYNLGVCPTPLQYFSLFVLDVQGGVMITGSHNPPEYNGFKLSLGKTTLHGDAIQEIKAILEGLDGSLKARKGEITDVDIIERYRSYMLERFSYLDSPEYRRLKVVVDPGNGTAGLVIPEILESIGCDVVRLYCEPDGRFPNHHPDPTVVENIQDLIERTLSTGADIGVGYDGDADRIGIVDSTGEIIWGDQIMIILSREILKRHRGATIIGDVKCSQTLFNDIIKNGGNPVMWKTGHSLVKDKMRKEGAILAGELSGHIFIADDYFGYDDALYTTLRIVEIMKTTGKSIKALLTGIPEMFSTPEIRLDCPETKKKAVVQRVLERFRTYHKNSDSPYPVLEIQDIDGVRALFERGWALLRSSNTQPVVVMRVEAEDEESLSGYRRFMEDEFLKAMEEL
ncbi:MAG TPA: phosphomannomutase/phosphoglucomutase [Nitrospirae bacterium]|nr:phosphomannomutase/phosphoglucomutase [Nitrospirota bacterium]